MTTLVVEIENVPPKVFVRGQTLEFLMELPCDVPKDYFWNSVVGPPAVTVETTLKAELRQVENSGAGGFIANLNPVWEPNTNYTKIRFLVSSTDAWPLGPAEFDVLFTRSVNTDPPNTTVVKTFRSLPVRIEIQDKVTA